MIAALRRMGAALAAFAAVAAAGGCESIYGIGDLPHGGGGTPDAQAGTDAGPCTPLTVANAPTKGAVACASTGTCSPDDVSTYAPQWVPPVDRTGACTTAQIAEYFAKCIDTTTGTIALCDAFKAEARNTACFNCLIVPGTASRYGAAVAIAGTANFQINRPGCLALAEPCNQPCAEASLKQILCAYASCDPTGNCTNSGDTALTSCLTTATASPSGGAPCACQAFAAAGSCIDNMDAYAQSKCGGTGIELYKNVAAFMCGPL